MGGIGSDNMTVVLVIFKNHVPPDFKIVLESTPIKTSSEKVFSDDNIDNNEKSLCVERTNILSSYDEKSSSDDSVDLK